MNTRASDDGDRQVAEAIDELLYNMSINQHVTSLVIRPGPQSSVVHGTSSDRTFKMGDFPIAIHPAFVANIRRRAGMSADESSGAFLFGSAKSATAAIEQKMQDIAKFMGRPRPMPENVGPLRVRVALRSEEHGLEITLERSPAEQH